MLQTVMQKEPGKVKMDTSAFCQFEKNLGKNKYF